MSNDIIERQVHTFLFKWRNELSRKVIISGMQEQLWDSFINNNIQHINIIMEKIKKPTYNYKIHLTHVHNIMCNNIKLPDIEICKRMLFTEDNIIKIYGVDDVRNDQPGYCIISACGTILFKSRDELKHIKYGAIKFADGIIDIINILRNDICVKDIVEIIKDLDDIQKNILYFFGNYYNV
jgi:hypothetical protein